ncbi:phosphate ABC transporter substrate-binding protein [Colwelliaceae bacterium 6471]
MKKIITIVMLYLVSLTCLAEHAVIMHPSSSETLDTGNIAKIFLGKTKTFPSGERALPINQDNSQAIRKDFDEKVLNKSTSQIKAYWSKRIFTGKGTPPEDVANAAEVIDLVANNTNAIGYIDASLVTDAVKVVAKF